jgi:predicted phage replisome organizer/uncharacterized phage protein (TIGR02220 family)
MSQVKWIKINTDIFDNKKIKLIESMPEADAIFKIWIHLLVLAANSNNNGMIYLSEKIPYTIEMLSTIFNKPLNIVRLSIETFKQFEMITIMENNFILLNDWNKHQNIEGLDKIREQNRIRQQRYIENQKKALININKDKDIEEDIRTQNVKTDVIIKVIEYLNLRCNKNFRTTTKKNIENISARFDEGYKLPDFIKVIDNKLKDNWFINNPKYYNPITLFRPSHFEIYLNETQEELFYFEQKNNWKDIIKEYEYFYENEIKNKIIWNEKEENSLKEICRILNNHFKDCNLCFAEIFWQVPTHWRYLKGEKPLPSIIQKDLNDFIKIEVKNES